MTQGTGEFKEIDQPAKEVGRSGLLFAVLAGDWWSLRLRVGRDGESIVLCDDLRDLRSAKDLTYDLETNAAEGLAWVSGRVEGQREPGRKVFRQVRGLLKLKSAPPGRGRGRMKDALALVDAEEPVLKKALEEAMRRQGELA